MRRAERSRVTNMLEYPRTSYEGYTRVHQGANRIYTVKRGADLR